jgi:hypothetical protein
MFQTTNQYSYVNVYQRVYLRITSRIREFLKALMTGEEDLPNCVTTNPDHSPRWAMGLVDWLETGL